MCCLSLEDPSLERGRRNCFTQSLVAIPNAAGRTKLSWSLWSYQWTPDEEGETRLVVRATDGNGQLQISEYRDQVPDGATGLHRVRARVEKA